MATIMKAIPTRPAKAGKLAGVSPNVLLLRNELRAGTMETVATLALGSRTIDICTGADSLWAIIRRPRRGGLALRVAHAPGGRSKLTKKRGGSREALHSNSKRDRPADHGGPLHETRSRCFA